MSTALTYREPYRFSAGVLALAVHLVFFSMLYFGVRWQSQPPQEFMVEMWESLPNTEAVPEPEPAVPAKVEPAPAPVPAPAPRVVPPAPPPVKADIEVRDKKSGKKNKKAEAKAKQAKQAEEKKKAAAAKAKKEKERRELDEYVARRVEAEQARIRAEVDAATATQVGRYQDLIRNKIRRNIVMPPDVPESATAEFKVTVLPDGEVMEVELLKSSGNTAYDNAAERAIYKAQPLPVPTDASLQKMFRELRLTIRP